MIMMMMMMMMMMMIFMEDDLARTLKKQGQSGCDASSLGDWINSGKNLVFFKKLDDSCYCRVIAIGLKYTERILLVKISTSHNIFG